MGFLQWGNCDGPWWTPERRPALEGDSTGLQPSLDSKRGFYLISVNDRLEIASQAGEDDFEDDTLVSTPELQVLQVLVVHAQNEVIMATGTPMSAPSTPTVALSTAP